MEYEPEFDDLDDDWIKQIEEEEQGYTSFYREPNDTVKIFFTYVNSENKIYYIKKDIIALNDGYLNRDILIHILKNHKMYNNINHEVISLLQYNIDLEPQNVMPYLKQKQFDKQDFLSVKSNFDDIYWKDSVTLFKDLNSLYVLFYEKQKKKKNNQTKKVFINKKHKKRLKKTFKRI